MRQMTMGRTPSGASFFVVTHNGSAGKGWSADPTDPADPQKCPECGPKKRNKRGGGEQSEPSLARDKGDIGANSRLQARQGPALQAAAELHAACQKISSERRPRIYTYLALLLFSSSSSHLFFFILLLLYRTRESKWPGWADSVMGSRSFCLV